MMNAYIRLEKVLNHIQNVQRFAQKLGIILIKNGEQELGRNLIANAQLHDNSKLKGIEFDHLFAGDELLAVTIQHHRNTNPHHPEYWGGIERMPEVYIAEMVCDFISRSTEFGTDVRSWIESSATKKYNFTMTDEVGTKISKFVDLVLEKPFK